VAALEHRSALVRSRAEAWNVREHHMAETLEALVDHLQRTDAQAQVVAWAHNAHVGDADAIERGRAGRLSVGKLVRRRRRGAETALVGFTTYEGTVTAAPGWDEPAEIRELPAAHAGSHEWRFHRRELRRLVLEPSDLLGSGSERAVGVIYRSGADPSEYFDARIGDEFDVVVHLDETRAVEPLDHAMPSATRGLALTYPHGL
jgi:erythromycin esterase-like protein